MFGRLAMGFANVRAGTRVLMLVLGQACRHRERALRDARYHRPAHARQECARHGGGQRDENAASDPPRRHQVPGRDRADVRALLLQVSDLRLPCNIRREGGQSLVIGGSSLVISEGKACDPL